MLLYIAEDDEFFVNDSFTSKLVRIKVSTIADAKVCQIVYDEDLISIYNNSYTRNLIKLAFILVNTERNDGCEGTGGR